MCLYDGKDKIMPSSKAVQDFSHRFFSYRMWTASDKFQQTSCKFNV